jgi:hypothetical protein
MHESEMLYRSRIGEVSELVCVAARTDPIIHKLLEQYGRGIIVTKEEMLCRMVLELAEQTESQRWRLIEAAQRATQIAIAVPTIL